MFECHDKTNNVNYPRHEEYTGRGYCVRCGATTDAALHAAFRADEAKAVAEKKKSEKPMFFGK